MPVYKMMREMSSREFSYWMAYDRIDAFGEQRAELRAGEICAMIFNANRGKGVKPAKAKDYMHYLPRKKVQTQAEFDAAARSIFEPMVTNGE